MRFAAGTSSLSLSSSRLRLGAVSLVRAMLEFWIVLDLDMVSLDMMIDEGVRDSRVLEQMRVVRLGFWLLFCIASLEADGRKGSLMRCWPVLHDVVAGKVCSVSEGEEPYYIAAWRCFGFVQYKLRLVNLRGSYQTRYRGR
jgi:hypothetical protein